MEEKKIKTKWYLKEIPHGSFLSKMLSFLELVVYMILVMLVVLIILKTLVLL